MRLALRNTRLGAGAAVAMALAVPVVLAGCSAEVSVGGASEASGEEIAEEIRGDYAEQTGVELPKLTCDGVEGDVGARFGCSGSNARGVRLEIAGRVTDTGDDGFDYSWEVAEAVAPGVLYERALERSLEEGGIDIEVRCPAEIEVEVGSKLRCEASDQSGSSRGVTLHLTDLDGGFDYAVDREASKGDSSTS